MCLPGYGLICDNSPRLWAMFNEFCQGLLFEYHFSSEQMLATFFTVIKITVERNLVLQMMRGRALSLFLWEILPGYGIMFQHFTWLWGNIFKILVWSLGSFLFSEAHIYQAPMGAALQQGQLQHVGCATLHLCISNFQPCWVL